MPSKRKQFIKEATKMHERIVEGIEPEASSAASASSSSSSGVEKGSKKSKQAAPSSSSSLPGMPKYKNKNKVLVLSSRGVTSQQRHLVEDVRSLIPHSKKDTKLDSKKGLDVINEIASVFNCTGAIYFEARKHQDLFVLFSLFPMSSFFFLTFFFQKTVMCGWH